MVKASMPDSASLVAKVCPIARFKLEMVIKIGERAQANKPDILNLEEILPPTRVVT
jgi:hypothetical protein